MSTNGNVSVGNVHLLGSSEILDQKPFLNTKAERKTENSGKRNQQGVIIGYNKHTLVVVVVAVSSEMIIFFLTFFSIYNTYTYNIYK